MENAKIKWIKTNLETIKEGIRLKPETNKKKQEQGTLHVKLIDQLDKGKKLRP